MSSGAAFCARSNSTLARIIARKLRKNGKRREAQEIAAVAAVEIGVEHGVGMRPEPALAEIHQEEREIVEDVDGGETVVELDRIEQHGPAVDLDDVAQVKIAVAVAHIAVARPRPQQRG